MTNSEALGIITQVMDMAFKGGAFATAKDAAKAVEALEIIQLLVPADDQFSKQAEGY